MRDHKLLPAEELRVTHYGFVREIPSPDDATAISYIIPSFN